MKQIILSILLFLFYSVVATSAFSYSQCANEYPSPREASYPTQIAFTNETGKLMNVYWIDFQGQRVFAGSLGQHQTLDLNTFYHHVWIVTDVWGNCIQAFFAGSAFTPIIVY